MYGLDETVINDLKRIFSKFSTIEKVILYGSRAMGTYRNGSDIDITLLGKNLSNQTIFDMQDEIEALYLPYSFDISILDRIDNEDLIDHIRRVGKVFFKKSESPLRYVMLNRPNRDRMAKNRDAHFDSVFRNATSYGLCPQ